ncbi:TonB-dependent receptor [Bacteroides sp. ET71]|uniref:SusC/RagA family TonB-linked outer membrane protein n=1 Tax=Bacteroides sp. ET71 TaxID=2939421 RepID=UPI002012F81A|nr:TonB-dependent receptor [Bacteroides sp. ET71]MCL1615837.1 TonB-dependent receptor [Bacteroides sp. ET71]
MKRKLNLCIAFLFLFTGIVSAQITTINGRVIAEEDEEPIVGATVRLDGTKQGTITDVNGNFRFDNVPKNAHKMIISFIGMKTEEVDLASNVTVRLKSDIQALDEVVIQVAYGTAKKTSLTGAISNIDATEIAKRPTTSVVSALEGTTSGIQVNNTYGQPGESPSIRIRGFNTVNGDNSPLYVLDGVPFGGNISDLNSADIESISVLKDAASAALYGNRAANGVILITTKRGKNDRARVNISTTQGIYTRGIAEYDRLGANEWMEAMWQGYRNQLVSTGTPLDEANALTSQNLISEVIGYNIYNKANNELFDANGKLVADARIKDGFKNDLDWYKPIERTGYRQEYVISGDGAYEKGDFYFSASYLNEEGYIKNSGFERLTGRANVNLKPTKWFKTGFSISGTHQVTDLTNGDDTGAYTNPFVYARNMAPVYPVHLHDMSTGDYILDDTGNLVYDDGVENGRPQNNGRHMIWENELNMDRTYRNTLNAQLYAEINFLKDFTFTLKGDLNVRNTENRSYDNAIIGDGQGNNGRSSRTIYRYKNYTVQQQLNWRRTFGAHYVDALVAHEAYAYKYNYLYGYKVNETFSGKEDLVNFNEITNLTDYENNYRTESYLGRVRYNFAERYHVEAAFRRDGSSRFHPDNRWGNFWSLGASWIISEENFLKKYDWIDMLKLRASYGEVGNDAGVSYYGYMSLYTIAQNANQAALYKSQNEASDIKWETTSSFGIALEGTLFDRLNFTFEYFDKRSRDLLFDVNLPLSVGGTTSDSAEATITQNLGSVSNRGVEIDIDGDIIRNRNWVWNLGLNATFIKNKIVRLPEQHRENGLINGTKKYMEGHGVYDFWMYQYVGVDQMTGNSLYLPDLEAYSIEEIPEEYLVQIGDNYYTTYTTYAKRDWSGSAIPKVYGSISTSLQWKNLAFSALFTYSLGGKIYDYSYASLMGMTSNPSAAHKDILNSWKGIPEGMTEDSPNRIDPNGTPIINYELSSRNNAQSTRFLTNASYLVIKNLTLSYDFPKSLIQKIDLKSLRLNASVENLATFTHRKGMNPQQNFSGTSSDVLVTPRVFTIGLNVTF